MKPVVVYLCTEAELLRERRGYFKAFAKIAQPIALPALAQDTNHDIESLVAPFVTSTMQPVLLLHPDAYPRRLPHGLNTTSIPTACFSIDTYEQISSRIHFAQLFDYAFVFHPGYDRLFQQAGHPRAICLPHAVEHDLFVDPTLERVYEVGWVGRLDGSTYTFRRHCIQQLEQQFKVNDIYRYYSPEEMAAIYQQSQIVVNLSRDDYLQDANLRCFEAMAAGALLITPKPTELAELGFVEGTHYITFQQAAELTDLVNFYLDHPSQRIAIAQAGRDLVLQKHTYDARVQTILETLAQDAGKHFAPARHWSEAKVQALYTGYFAESQSASAALREWQRLLVPSPLRALLMLPIVLKALFVRLRSQLLDIGSLF
jgi:Glycosyl transferases group 1